MRNDLAAVEVSDVARRRRQARRRTIGVVGVAVMLPVFAILAGPSGGETAPEIAANRTVAFTNAGHDRDESDAVDGSADELAALSEPTRRVNLDPVLPRVESASPDLAVGSAPELDPAPARPAKAAPRSAVTPAQNPVPSSDAPVPVPTSVVEGVVSGAAIANVASLPAAQTTAPETTTPSSTASSETTVSTGPEPVVAAPPETIATTEPPTTEPPTTEPPTTEPAPSTEPPAPDPAPPVEPVEDDALSAREEKQLEREQKKEEREQIKADRFDE